MVEESSAVSSRKKGVGLMSGDRGCCCSRLTGKPGLRAPSGTVEPAGWCTEGNSDDEWIDEGVWDDDTGVADWDDKGCGDENAGLLLLSPTTGERGGMSRTKGEKSDRSVGWEDCCRSREIGVEVKLK